MMDAEKIAREVLVGHTFIATDRKRYVGLLAEPVEERIATAIRSAYASGYDAAREQAAEVGREAASGVFSTPNRVAVAIMSMEPPRAPTPP